MSKCSSFIFVGLVMLCISASTACTDSTGTFSGSSLKAQIPAEASQASGAADYNAACLGCHGMDGLGTPRGNSLKDCESCTGTFHNLQTRVHETMPEGSPGTCEDNCATDTAAHILCAFNAERTDGCKIVVPATASRAQGSVEYGPQCQDCHGVVGEGNSQPYGPALDAFTAASEIRIDGVPDTLTFSRLRDKIDQEMPKGDPGASSECKGTCADDVSAFILCEFNGELADGCGNPLQGPMIPPSADLADGKASYGTHQCEFCHGTLGKGGLGPALNAYTAMSTILLGGEIVPLTFFSLKEKNDVEMPPFNPTHCDDTNSTCATDTAAYIFCCFNPGLADGCPVLPEDFCPVPPSP